MRQGGAPARGREADGEAIGWLLVDRQQLREAPEGPWPRGDRLAAERPGKSSVIVGRLERPEASVAHEAGAGASLGATGPAPEACEAGTKGWGVGALGAATSEGSCLRRESALGIGTKPSIRDVAARALGSVQTERPRNSCSAAPRAQAGLSTLATSRPGLARIPAGPPGHRHGELDRGHGPTVAAMSSSPVSPTRRPRLPPRRPRSGWRDRRSTRTSRRRTPRSAASPSGRHRTRFRRRAIPCRSRTRPTCLA